MLQIIINNLRDQPAMRRRTLLRRGVVLAVIGSAGCTGGGDAPTETAPAATDTPTDSPTATDTPTASPSPTPTPTETPTPSAAVSVDVGPDEDLRFDPEEFTISVGETVNWVFRSRGHNVKPGSIPEDADWTGTPGEEQEVFFSGYEYRYTFTVAGSYDYYCAPHRDLGMVGSFTVEE